MSISTKNHQSKNSDVTALWIPGIQDCPGDREVLCNNLLDNSLLVQNPDAQYKVFDTFTDKSNWIKHKIEVEIELIKEQGHRAIIGNSFGAHRATDIINACPQIEMAILLNPPKNEISKATKANDTDRASPSEIMLRPLALDMLNDTFNDFLARHEQSYMHERKRMRKELRALKNGKPFEELLRKCREDIELLIVQAPTDPWHIQEELSHSNLKHEKMDDTYHYPHVSKPQILAKLICKWINGIRTTNKSESESAIANSDASILNSNQSSLPIFPIQPNSQASPKYKSPS